MVTLVGGVTFSSMAADKIDKAVIPKAPPFPRFRSVKVEPANLVLANGRDERRVLVWGETASGEKFDVSSLAKFEPAEDVVKLDAQGYCQAKRAGETTVKVIVENLSTTFPVKVESAEMPPVRFVRDVEPMLSKVGCNAGTCHGSAKGKNGFKLSLRGYDPEYDYQALIEDLSGRRFNRVVVDDSLMLMKPTADVPHEGRQVIKPGSRDYVLLKQWISEGTRFEEPVKARAQKIEVLPTDVELDLPGRSQSIMVVAHYADGTTRDVTREAVISSNNGDVAAVKDGVVTALRRGEAAALVRYEGSYATRLVSVMGDRTGFKWSEQPEHNYIDRHVNAKLKKMKMLPSELCTDAEFIRRVSLDLTGAPAIPERVRKFIDDKTTNKRERLIDELIGSPEYVDYWANKWADLLQCNSENLGQKGVWVFREWIHQAIVDNVPYDRMVRTLLTAKGSSYLNPEVNYLRVLKEPGKMTEDISQTFLGVRFNCNKCHDHPFERWTQNQYYEFGAYFAQVGIKKGTSGKETVRNETGDPVVVTGEEIVFRKYDGGEVKHPKTDKVVGAKVPFGEAKPVDAKGDRRDSFVTWMTSRDNPLFGMAMANRTWSYFFGRGIIDPVDDIRGSNPASNPELLQALTADFLKENYDVRKLMRTICQSRTYQLSIVKNRWNEDDSINFSHATPRRLGAEQLLDAVAAATGVRPKFAGMPAGMRAVQIPDGIVTGSDFLSLFGRPKRQSACECERTGGVTLSHALNLINGSTIGEAVSEPNSRIAKLVQTEASGDRLTEEIYLSVLNRPPTAPEKSAVIWSDEKAKRLEVAQDLTWALMNSPSFLFNR